MAVKFHKSSINMEIDATKASEQHIKYKKHAKMSVMYKLTIDRKAISFKRSDSLPKLPQCFPSPTHNTKALLILPDTLHSNKHAKTVMLQCYCAFSLVCIIQPSSLFFFLPYILVPFKLGSYSTPADSTRIMLLIFLLK